MTRREYSRNTRLEGAIRAELAAVLLGDVNDPRLEAVTVSGVRLSPDRSSAQIFFSVVGDDERVRQASDGFTAAASFLRRELGRRERLRVVPELSFRRDPSYEYGDRMERLCDRLRDQGELGGDGGSGDGDPDDGGGEA